MYVYIYVYIYVLLLPALFLLYIEYLYNMFMICRLMLI